MAVILSAVAALAGGWLLFDFCLWYFKGKVTAGTIQDFEKGKPVVSFETEDGKVTRRVSRIMRLSYFLSDPQPGEIFNVIYRPMGDTPNVRLHGYMGLMSGVLLLIPLPGALAAQYGRDWLAGQVSFILVFVGLMVGVWVFLKLLRRNY
ncbi:MAG: hypothetical protein WBK55_00840 [Alphaproteobacteria bacterium]